MMVSSPFSFDIFAFVVQNFRRMRSRAYINVAVFLCEPVDQCLDALESQGYGSETQQILR